MQKKRAEFLDAPVSGGAIGAQEGVLTVMVGGDETVLDSVKVILELYSSRITYIGPSGSGQQCKMVNQIMGSSIIEAISEALYFGKTVGLDMKKVLSAVSQGAAGSWMLEHRADTMLKGEFEDFGFAAKHMKKDVEICLAEAKEHNLVLPMLKKVHQQYITLVNEMDRGEDDFSALIDVL